MKSCLITGFVAASMALGVQAAEIDLPYIGEPADRSLSPLEELRLGKTVYHQLLAHGLIIEDPELDSYINQLGERLARHAGGGYDQLTFFFVNDDGINAFALPGGYIGINAGLITAAETEAELAGVVAHEIAHVTQRHIARNIEANKGWQMAGIGLMLAALIAGGGDPELAQAALGIGLSATYQRQVNFTRAHEIEADRVGIRTLAEAGFDPDGMAAFFQRLERQSRLYGEGVPDILRTHPVNTDRITEARSRAADYGGGSYRESDEFALVRARARVLSTRLNSDALAYFRATADSASTPADRYGLALALNAAGQYKLADELFAGLIKSDPKNLHYGLAHARNGLRLGRDEASLRELRVLMRAHPKQPAAVLGLADALVTTGQWRDARQLLLESDLMLDQNSESFRLLAIAAREMNQPAEAYFQMAAYRRLRGDYRGALTQLRNALQLPRLSQHDRQRITARYDEYRSAFPEAAREERDQQPSR